NADGTPTAETASRLFAAWTQAIVASQSPVIISGGAQRDADVMRTWLVDHAIPAARISVASAAHSIAQSAVGSAAIAAKLGLADIVLVTSPDQVRRAAADLVVAGVPVVSATTSTRELVGNLSVPAKVDQRAIYVDVSDILGLPSDRLKAQALGTAA
ncbi:YdcF family protein, partial [Williamsia sp.]|uniref:YdcF family protein n=1 Tax=Williamsia sp. TaxID=1872085 RepID=UPI002F924848